MGIASLVICVGYWIISRRAGSKNMRWKPRLIWLSALVIATFAAGQGGFAITNALTQQDAVAGYHQFLNGTVTAADVQDITCTEDGPCDYTYACDSYTTVSITYDSKGNPTTNIETHYRDCPYVTVEHRYSTTDSLGNVHQFGSFIDAQAKEWRAGGGIPSNLPKGIPGPWQAARTALDAGRGLPMTIDGEYENYILASEDTLLKASSDDIKKLKKAKALPEHTQKLHAPIYDQFNAKKVSFVGFKPKDEATWQDSVMQFNAALGMTLRGDLHVVVVKDSMIPSGVSPDDYANALKAYWLNDLGKYAFAKNGIMVVLGVDDDHKTIEWARADTGMPIGNGSMLQLLKISLTDTPFTPTSVMGDTHATVANGKLSYVYGQGLIPQAVMVQFPFQRACMECKDKGESSSEGFVNLTIDRPVDFWGYFFTILIVLAAVSIGWGLYLGYCRSAYWQAAEAARYEEDRRRQEELFHTRDPWDFRGSIKRKLRKNWR